MNFAKAHLKLIFLGLVSVGLLLAGCTHETTAPPGNLAPETYVTSYRINTDADSGSYYEVTVYWKGSDPDGVVGSFRYRVTDPTGDDTGNLDSALTDWQTTGVSEVTFTLLFYGQRQGPYLFEVAAQDNWGNWDTTPASVDIDRGSYQEGNYLPTTSFLIRPPDGAQTGQGVRFVLQGSDIDGSVTTFEYMLDYDTSWHSVAADMASETAELIITGVTAGGRTLTVRAKDNFGGNDASPMSASFEALTTFAPEFAFPFVDGFSYVAPEDNPVLDTAAIDLTVDVEFYYSALEEISYIFTDTTVNDTTNWVSNGTNTTITLTNLTAKDGYRLWVKVEDVGSVVTQQKVDFNQKVVNYDQGILLVNGVDWGTYGSQIINMYNAESTVGDHNVTWWDVFTVPPGAGYPDSLGNPLGIGSIPTWIFDPQYFTSIVWVGNNYAGDFPFYEESAPYLLAYVENGGNVILGCRYGHSFFDEESDDIAPLAEYCGTSDWSGTVSITGSNVLVSTTYAPDIVDIGPGNGSGSASLAQFCQISGAGITEVFSFDVSGTAMVGGFRVNKGGGHGQFVWISGRSYRLDTTAS
ncbi:MAG: hypothetical protein ACE5JC_01770, partial [Candidatus Zixiibacteriota bacterium]